MDMSRKITPWTTEQLDALIPKINAKIVEIAADQVEEVKPLGPMTAEECLDYFFRLTALASERPWTQRECFIHGQLLQSFRQAIMAEQEGKVLRVLRG